MIPVPEDTIFTASNIINFFVALGTCTAVLVALVAKKQSSFESTFSLIISTQQCSKRTQKTPQILRIN